MGYSIDSINTLAGTSYTYDILALNALCIAQGGTGGHTYSIDALNELCILLGITAGHTYIIDALNTIVTAIGGTGTYTYEDAAWQFIADTGFLDTENIIQKLDFTMDDAKQYLLDVSGNSNNGKLVKSNCYLGNNFNNFSTISTDPVTDNLKFYDFSVEFWFSVAATSGYQVLLGRATGALTKNLLSVFCCDGGKLKYYSGNDTTNVTVDIIASVSTNTVYHVKCSVVNSTGNIAWEVNGVAGSSTFSNKTPATNQANDIVRMSGVINAGSPYYYLQNNGKLFGVKYYQAVNYATLGNYWPIAEGGGTTVYDVVGSKNLTLTTASWSTQDDYHYNLTKGFQLYGNSDANNSIIRVPYNNDGTTESPTISGYTKFADCPAGSFHNFAETGVQRNYNNVAGLTSAGISSTNIVYYGGVTGYSGYAFCKNHMGEETDYTVFSTQKNRYASFGNKSYSQYMDESVTQVLVAGSTGKIHSTNFKKCINRTVSSTVYYDMFIREGTYELTTTSQLSIIPPAKCGIIGESKTGTILQGHLPAATAKATIEATSTIHTNGNSFRVANITVTAQNLRYAIHHDNSVISPVVRISNAIIQHLGNAEAIAVDPTVLNLGDGYGSGFQDGLDSVAIDCQFIGKAVASGDGRGFAAHSRPEVYSNPAVLKFTRCSFECIDGDYSFRWSTGATGQLDEMQFDTCDFNDQQLYFDPATSFYDAMADKWKASKKTADIAPTIYAASPTAYLGLQISSASASTLVVNSGTTATLLFSSPKTIDAKTQAGRKNISESITGAQALKALLGNCSSVNKTLSVKIDGIDTNIVFNQNYSAMTNAAVLTSINSINPDVVFSEYNYTTNATFTNV